MPAEVYGWAPLAAVTDGRWRLIAAPRPELYDVAADRLTTTVTVTVADSGGRGLAETNINALSSNTATVNVNKSVSNLAIPGAVGSIVALNGGPAIEIAASSLTVALRNVVIGPVAGTTTGTDGVEMTGNSSLIIENSLIANLPEDGVYVDGGGILKLTDSTLRNNGDWAVRLLDGATADVAGTRMLNNGSGGLFAGGGTGVTTTASVSDSIISGGGSGISTVTAGSVTARVSVTRSTITRASYGLYCASAGSAIFVGGTTI